MKKFVGVVGILILLASSIPSVAIEGLHISVQSSNAVLSWPSTNIETYIVQYRSNLNAAFSWLTLTDYFSAAPNTNTTLFVHSNNMPVKTGFYRVVRDGAHLFGITNGTTLSGVVTIPVEVANGYGNLDNLSLTENDAPVNGITSQAPPIPLPLQLTVDTTLMSNGVHQISASARWEDTNGGAWEADSPPVTVNVYNEITFPNWMPRFGELGNTLMIAVQSAHTNADWWIDIYDSHYAYVGTFAGHTDDGNIGGVWNLVGPYGELHTNDNFFIFVVTTVFQNGSSAQISQGGASPTADSTQASAVTPKIQKKLEHWLGAGAWVAVEQHAWDGAIDNELLYEELGGFVGAAQGVGWQVSPPPYQGEYNIAPYALNFGADNPQGDVDWANFRQALYDPHSRNLVYFGHGGAGGIGYNPANANRYISAAEIGNMLHTIPAGQTNSHSFRFVFLDGCSTAKGTLPEAFGIFHKEDVPGWEYADASLRYSAFVGWPKDKWIAILNGNYINYDHVNFITYIQWEMLGIGYSGSPQPIKQAIINASNYPNLSGFSANSLKVFGFWGLTFGLVNY